MNAFQILALTFLTVLAVLTVEAAARGGIRKRIASFWLFIWIAAAVAFAWPRAVGLLAKALGIGRGADLVMYCSVVMTLVGFFYTYTRFRRLDRQLTLLVRRLAIAGAKGPAERDGAAPPPHP